MSTANKIRSLEKGVTVLWGKYKQYEDRLEALDATQYLNSRSFWSYATGSGNVEREKTNLRGKMSDVMSDITSCENEIRSIREGAASGIWHSEV
jgi:hypothetical protein